MKRTELLSIALVTIMALTVVSGAGVLKAQAATTPALTTPVVSPNPVVEGDYFTVTTTLTKDPTMLVKVYFYCRSASTDVRLPTYVDWYGQGDSETQIVTTYLSGSPLSDYNPWSVQCVVTDMNGAVLAQTAIVSFEMIPDTTPPTVEAGGPYSVDAGQQLTFAATASDPSTPLTYGWAFGDGTTSTTLNPTHTYAKAGSYTATLTVTDSAGNSASDTATVTVNPTKASVAQDVQGVQATIVQLSSSNFVSKNAQRGMTNDLYSAIKTVNAGHYSKAVTQLRSTLAKTDGCAITGKPDKNDVINNCAAQGQVYPQLVYVIKELSALQ